MSIVVALQFAYALIGTVYNVHSIARIKTGRAPLSATNPYKGVAIMAAVAGVTLSQPYLHGVPYILGWLFLIVFLGRGPVTNHFRAIRSGQNLELYSSRGAAFTAFAINAFGVAVGCLGVALIIADILGR
jgi:hypothetical protein